MQLANITLALGGDMGQTIQKFEVTPAEVAVLREIHGEGAVYEIQPLDHDVKRSNRDELVRLRDIYGKPPGSPERSAVDVLFPGAAARVFENFDELEIDESLYKATARATPKKAKKPEPEPEPEEVEDEVEEEDPPPAPVKKPAAKKAAPAKKKSGKKTFFK